MQVDRSVKSRLCGHSSKLPLKEFIGKSLDKLGIIQLIFFHNQPYQGLLAGHIFSLMRIFILLMSVHSDGQHTIPQWHHVYLPLQSSSAWKSWCVFLLTLHRFTLITPISSISTSI